MSFPEKLSAARTIIQDRAAVRGFATGAGHYASVSAFNQNDEGIWRNGTGIFPDRSDMTQAGGRINQLYLPQLKLG